MREEYLATISWNKKPSIQRVHVEPTGKKLAPGLLGCFFQRCGLNPQKSPMKFPWEIPVDFQQISKPKVMDSDEGECP